MKKPAFIAGIVLLCAVQSARAMYDVADAGAWPADWPKELEPLRKQAKSLYGPMLNAGHHVICFESREQFEATWPQLLKVKTKGAPVFLVKADSGHFFDPKPAGVVVHCPPVGTDTKVNPEAPLAGKWEGNQREQWMWTSFIELAVDGKIVDLNRIQLPAGTPIIDERFNKK